MRGFTVLPFSQMVFNDIVAFGKDFSEVCTRSGEFKMTNFSFAKTALIQKFPPGDFKFVLKVHDDVDDNIFNITIIGMGIL